MRAGDPFDDLAAARDALGEAVRAAGAIALAHFQTGVRTWTKGPARSPVTEADLAVDVFLRERLSLLAPAYGWLSEETRDSPDRLTRKRLWIVDPIDGTRAFVAGGADWTISAALVEDGRPLAAALYAPVSDELFAASRGAGATRNGSLVFASRAVHLGGARMAGPKQGYPYVTRLLDQADSIERIRSLALRLARIAQGMLDLAFAAAGGQDWDLAAADLLVHEAGGRLTTHDGVPLAYNREKPVHGPLVAAGAGLHRVVLAELAAATSPAENRSR